MYLYSKSFSCSIIFYHLLTLYQRTKILDWSKSKAFADDKIKVLKMMIFVLYGWKDCGKRRKRWYQHFLLFPLCFQRAFYQGSLKVGIVWYRVSVKTDFLSHTIKTAYNFKTSDTMSSLGITFKTKVLYIPVIHVVQKVTEITYYEPELIIVMITRGAWASVSLHRPDFSATMKRDFNLYPRHTTMKFGKSPVNSFWEVF